MLVVDASLAIRACGGRAGFDALGDPDIFAPPLLWSEFRSSVHEATWRREIDRDRLWQLIRSLDESPLRERRHRRLGHEALRVADELGWAKTYDAEYVALARLLGCRLVTVDGRLRRGAARLGIVVTPGEL